MSVQNSLKKPVFTKSVRGYSVQEVDRYIEYVNERYSAVCRESAELKRKLTRFKLGLDRPEGMTPPTNVDISSEELTKQVEDLRRELAAECERHAEHLKKLSRDFENDMVNTVCRETNTEKGAAETVENDAQSSRSEPVTDENTASETEPVSAKACDSADGVPLKEQAEAPVEISADKSGDFNGIVEVTANEISEDGKDKNEEKTPAQLAEEIDFYSDSVHADGESFDPMTFAADAAAKHARPSFASLMGDDPEK